MGVMMGKNGDSDGRRGGNYGIIDCMMGSGEVMMRKTEIVMG